MVEWGVKETHDIQVPLLPLILVSADATLTLISWQMFPDLQSHYPRPFEPGRLVSCPLHRSRLLPGQHLPTLSLFSPHWALHIHKMAKTMPESHETKVSFGHGQQQQRETWIAHCQKVWTDLYSFENIPSVLVLVHCNLEVENSSKDRILAWCFEGLHHSFPQHEKLFYHLPIVDWWGLPQAGKQASSSRDWAHWILGSHDPQLCRVTAHRSPRNPKPPLRFTFTNFLQGSYGSSKVSMIQRHGRPQAATSYGYPQPLFTRFPFLTLACFIFNTSREMKCYC